MIEEANPSSAVVARYSQGLNIDEPLAMLRSGATDFYEADGLGSVTSLTSAAGALAQTYTFDSFGKQTASSGSLTNAFQYTGREFDPETGLYYYRARYYDPSTGRFMRQDPAGVSGDVNFYRYSFNSPTGFVDPMGLKGCASGSCADCPNGTWMSGVAAGEGGVDIGPTHFGGLVFSGIFICTSNPTFNVPWTSFCGQGYVGKKFPSKGGAPSPKAPATNRSFKPGYGFGGGFIRCTGYKCKEDLGGGEGGGFFQAGSVFAFGESSTSHSGGCQGIGVELGEGWYGGGFGCYTVLGKSLTW